MTTHSVDNGHTLAGKYGFTNPIIGWLINRGYGELVALTTDELQAEEISPKCQGRLARLNKRGEWEPDDTDRRCLQPMRYRPEGWVCYEHAEPVREPRAPRLQKIPPPPFSWHDVVGKEVDLVYSSQPGERPSWKYVVDGVVQ